MDGYVTIGTELDTKSFDKQIALLEDKLEGLEEEFELAKKWDLPESDLKEYRSQIEKTKNKIIDLRKRQEELNKTDFSNLGKGMTGIVKKVAKWSLAIFGIRTAYNAIRNAINVISEDDEQLKADIDYIKIALAYTLEPIVRTIVNLVKDLLIAIRNIIYAISGKNIFEKSNKGLKKAVGSAKELTKQLAGFDEMNILGSKNDSGGGSVSPSFDLSKLENTDTSGLYKWLDKVKIIFDTAFKGIIDNISKIMSDLGFSEGFIKAWEYAVDGVKKIIDGLLDTIKNILQTIVGLVTGDTQKVKD